MASLCSGRFGCPALYTVSENIVRLFATIHPLPPTALGASECPILTLEDDIECFLAEYPQVDGPAFPFRFSECAKYRHQPAQSASFCFSSDWVSVDEVDSLPLLPGPTVHVVELEQDRSFESGTEAPAHLDIGGADEGLPRVNLPVGWVHPNNDQVHVVEVLPHHPSWVYD